MTCPHTFWEEKNVNLVFDKKMNGGVLTAEEIDAYRTYVLFALAKAYHDRNIAMQFHFASIRDNNALMFKALGPDTGYDAVHDKELAEGCASAA